MKREISKSRPESRPRPRQRRNFFLGFMFEPEIDENFRISHNLGLGLAAKISQAFAIQLVCYRDQYTPPKLILVKSQELCVPVEILGP
jgi:hypothetical protein